MRLRRALDASTIADCERRYRSIWGCITRPGWAWWAIDGDPSLGFCAAAITADGTTVRLEHAWTAPEMRGQGWQSRMIRVRVSFGRRRGVDRAYTYTHVTNVKSQRNIARAGLLPTRHIPEKDGLGWLVYEKALRS